MVEYNLWKPGVGNQNLTLVVRDYLEVFREIIIFNYARSTMEGPVRPCCACNFRALSDWTTVLCLESGTHTAIIGNGCPIPKCISTVSSWARALHSKLSVALENTCYCNCYIVVPVAVAAAMEAGKGLSRHRRQWSLGGRTCMWRSA